MLEKFEYTRLKGSFNAFVSAIFPFSGPRFLSGCAGVTGAADNCF